MSSGIIIPYAKMWANWREYIDPLDNNARGQLFTALLDYINTGEVPSLTGDERILFPTFKSYIDRDVEKYRDTSQKRSEAGKQGGRPQKQKKQLLFEEANDFLKSQEERKEEKRQKDKKNKDSLPLNPPKGENASISERFERFWMAYPKKVGKENAKKAFTKLDPSKELLEIILSAVERQRRSDQWIRDNGQYIPYPTTWLNGRRWEDEVASSSGSFCRSEDIDISDIFN